MASTFSYAQAAKGIAAPAPTKKSAPSLDGPTKDGATTAAATSWAEDVETESQVDQPTAARESRPQTTSAAAPRESRSADSSTSSPDLGASSSSTVTKDDDVSSIPNTSSESTWDNKSQASTSVDKTAEPAEKTSEKVKKGKNAVVKPLQEALPPAVNPWKMRAEELKAKVSKAPLVNGATQTSPKKSERAPLEKASSGDGRVKGREDGSANRNNARDTDTRKSAKGRFSEKDAKTGSSALPPPPNRDQESWPTPETVIDEDRKKAQEKGDRADKDRKENVPSGKHEWVKVPYTPTVVFNTPLPNAANARRGGRPGGRGGAQSSGRPTGSGSNGAGSPEKDGSAAEGANPEHAKQDRPEGITQDGFSKERRVDSAGAQGINGHASGVNGDLISKSTQPSAAESDVQPRRASEASHAHGQNTTYPRQYPNRSGKGRRGDFSGVGERRRNGEILPAKDNTSDELRPSTGTQTDASGENDRHSSTFPEAHNGHSVKHGRYTSFSNGRERGRGGRGARGNYSNGHQYGNGHQSMHASTFSMGPQSPTTFNPGNNSFFPHSQGKYTRNGHRSQSVTTDAYRFPPYQNGTPGQMPPYNMYDYGMMQPMSPMPFPYGVDYHALVALITTQVEYYFSVDNLLKDMYLRRHMDSQGFVTLEFIAGFNRIKSLSTDLEIVKHVCQQSAVIEYRVGEDGQDRLRRRDGWAQWVLSMKERDVSAQNDGPKELHQPPVPHVVGFEQPNSAQWTPMPSAVPFDNVAYPQTNGDHVTNQDLPPVPTENGITNASEDGVSSTNA